MNPVLNMYLAEALANDRLWEAEKFRRSRIEWSAEPERYDAVTVRIARLADARPVRRLAELDGRRPPPEPMLVAEVGGELLAARSLTGRGAVSDPFRPTTQLVELLELRSAHLRNGTDGDDTGDRGRFRRRARGRFHRGARGWLRSVVATSRS